MTAVHKVTLRHFDPLTFFLKLQKTEKSPSYVRVDEWTVIAWNPKRTLSTSSKNAFKKLRSLYNSKPYISNPSPNSHSPFLGGLIGYLSYDLGLALHGIRSEHRQSKLPLAYFHEYQSALLWNGRETFVVGDDAFIHQAKEIHRRASQPFSVPKLRFKSSITRADYGRVFTKIQRGILDGDFYQLNFTYALEAESSCDRRTLFTHLLKKTHALRASYIEGKGFAVLSLSPEHFVSVGDGKVWTSPIKGTRPRGETKAEDLRLRDELLKSEKEQAELNMITDLLRNDIGQISEPGSVRVTKQREIIATPSVWHTASTIEGRLRKGLGAIEVLERMFPGGSVTGCPKRAAMIAIDQLENSRRGAYTGASVMLSRDGTMTSSILIRTLVSKGKHLSLGIGGGIVADSVVRDEWEETQQKAKPFIL